MRSELLCRVNYYVFLILLFFKFVQDLIEGKSMSVQGENLGDVQLNSQVCSVNCLVGCAFELSRLEA